MQKSLVSAAFAASAVGLAMNLKKSTQKSSCAPKDNSAFVFIKPHANTKACQNLVKSTLASKGNSIDYELKFLHLFISVSFRYLY